MKIETKYDPGQEVWAIDDDGHFKATVVEILVSVRCRLPHIRYLLGNTLIKTENALFASQSELLASL